MSKIRSGGNKSTEVKLVKILRQNKVSGWRRNSKLLGKPDFVFSKERVVIFVDGCYWHGCRWHCRFPKSNQKYWESKIGSNKSRDKTISKELSRQGWKVLRIWEHELSDFQSVTNKIIQTLNKL